jgi:hypothetical protein
MKSWKNLTHWGDWRPREGQLYYYIDRDKVVRKEMWMGINNNEDNEAHYKTGNIYETEEKAKEKLGQTINR